MGIRDEGIDGIDGIDRREEGRGRIKREEVEWAWEGDKGICRRDEK